jgi:hypothetical protein
VTGEAQGISEQDGPVEVNLGGRFIGWSNEPVAGAMLALGLEVTRLSAALAERDRELAELRATIADLADRINNTTSFDDGGEYALVPFEDLAVIHDVTEKLDSLASSGSAPTGQEER